MPPDLVGVVIPAYIGAFSSLAGVIVAVVALVTARRARADARGAASASTLVAEREEATRAAARELAEIVQQLPTASASTPTAGSSAAAASAWSGPTGLSGGVPLRSSVPGRRPREPRQVGERRPYWADRPRPAVAVAARPDAGDTEADDAAVAAPSDRDHGALSRRLDDLVRRLSA